MNASRLIFVVVFAASRLIASEIMALPAESPPIANQGPRTIYLSHENDPKAKIAVTITEIEGEKHFGLQICDVAKPDSCQKLGRYDFYREEQLVALENSYRLKARLVLTVESLVVATGASVLLYQYFRNPAQAAEQLRAGIQEAGQSSGGKAGSAASMRMASLESAPGRASSPGRAAAMAAPPALESVQLADPSAEPSVFAPVWRYAGKMYKRFAEPMLYSMLLNAWGPFQNFATSMSSLLVNFLSVPEHYRAAQLIHDIVHAKSDIQFSRRRYASVEEYSSQYFFETMNDVKTKTEDLLAACGP